MTVVDDGTMPYKYGSMLFDYEGTRTQKTVLIEREKSFYRGNGRRESYAYKPIPRMRNTYIAPG